VSEIYKLKRIITPETVNSHVNDYIAVPDKEKLNLEEFKTELKTINFKSNKQNPPSHRE